MISELDRFLCGPKGQRRTALLIRRLAREAKTYRQMLAEPHTPEHYQMLCRRYEALMAAQALLEKELSRKENP